MAKIGVIVISYRADPQPLFNSIMASGHDVRWYIFVHGQDAALRSKLDALAAGMNARYFPYGVNRGVARSWNEGLQASFGDGNEVTIILNDDLFFYEGGFDQYTDFVLSEKRRVPEFGIITVRGLERGSPSNIGSGEYYLKSFTQGGACMAIGSGAVENVGYFDHNFWPAYFEDKDYLRRMHLIGVPLLEDERVLVEHNRSYTLRADPMLRRLHSERWRRNERYYLRKWGGLAGSEIFPHPFDDEGVGCVIPAEAVDAPYGAKYDRADLESTADFGLLADSFAEELAVALNRHVGDARRLLEWGAGEHTLVMAGFAVMRQTDLLLSIDHRAETLRRIAKELPRYSFLHFRCIDPEEMNDAADATDIAYTSYPSLLGIRFDVIVIAGKWRENCARHAQRLLAPNGIVVLQEHLRFHYSAMQELFDVIEEGRQSLVLREKR